MYDANCERCYMNRKTERPCEKHKEDKKETIIRSKREKCECGAYKHMKHTHKAEDNYKEINNSHKEMIKKQNKKIQERRNKEWELIKEDLEMTKKVSDL